MRTRATILAASLLAVAACSDNPIDSGTSDASTMNFTYVGARSGSFAVKGEPPAGQLPFTATYAHGARFTDSVSIEVGALLQYGGDHRDIIRIKFPSQRAGSFAINRSACENFDDTCAGINIALDIPSEAQGSYGCQLDTGTVRATSVTSTRIAGSFSGTGTCYDFNKQVDTPFEVTAGRFDVKLRNVRRD